MNKTIQVGKVNKLKVNRVSEPGLYLISEDEEEVLLPNSYVDRSMEVGVLIDVFIYTDSEDRLVSTTLKPYVYLEEFAFLEIVDSAKFGCFIDIGLQKDILVPKNKQKSSFHIGSRKVLQLQLDERTNRLIASEKFELSKDIEKYQKNDKIEILVYTKTPLGFKVIVDNHCEGMIFHNEIFEKIDIGDKKIAYIKNIRDDDKLDISLQKIGEKTNESRVLEVLESNGGKMEFNYKSSPQDIKEFFGLSKKAYKLTLTKLIDEKKIELKDSYMIRLATSL
jgi:predicted RNA-binding protein (virulence factor B family)